MRKFNSKQPRNEDLTDSFDNVTILFADIVNFTSFSNSVSPDQVFTLLRMVFTDFDKLCLKYHLYKLYTIGDCYVSISLIESTNRNIYSEAYNTVLFGFEMINVINEIRKRDKSFAGFNMRIGIHTVNLKIN